MSDPYIVANELGKSFNGKPVLADVSIAVEPGDIVGVLGKNGAGKTTLLELLLGFTPATAGSARLFGYESYRLPGAAKARVGFVPQQDELINQLTAADQIGVIASFYPQWDDALVLRLSREWEVDLRQRINGMSVGQRQKLSILLGLGHKPDVLILDEPVASLDPIARRQFLEQIIEVAADGRRSVVFSSHIVSDIERLANRIWILKDQRMYWQGDFDSLKDSIVRLHVRSTRALPASLAIPNALSLQRTGTTATAVVQLWHPDLHETLARQLDSEIEVEHLTLEDIFLELHRELLPMKAVLRLIVAYFTGTLLLRGITAIGLLAVVGGTATLLYLPRLVGGQGGPSPFSLGVETLLTLLPIAGVVCVAFGGSLLPALFARLASSHYAYVLPYGRAKLLASAFATIALVAFVAACTVTGYYVRTPMALDLVFERAFVVSLLTASLLYVVLGITRKSGSAFHLLIGSLVMIATLVLPIRLIAWPSRSLVPYWVACALLWGLFAVGFLLLPRLKGAFGRLKQVVTSRLPGASYDGRSEIEFLIGTARPWTLAVGQVVPIVIAAYFLNGFVRMAPSARSPWLFFLTILSILSGAIASVAATRSRGLWLRAHWTRAELFRRVEDAFWRHNSYALGVLLLMLVAVGTYFYLPSTLLAFGMGLVMLGTALSTYLGLMITARIGWIDAALAVATMLTLMLVAVYASAPSAPLARIVALEVALAAAALAFRHVAQRRWTNLDWMLCRADTSVRAST